MICTDSPWHRESSDPRQMSVDAGAEEPYLMLAKTCRWDLSSQLQVQEFEFKIIKPREALHIRLHNSTTRGLSMSTGFFL